MKYVFLAFKTIAAVIIVFWVAYSLLLIKGTQEYFDRMGEEARIRDEVKEESFNKLCDFAENNLDELLELSDMYISMLGPENAVGGGSAIYIEAEGDMQEFRDKLFDNVYEGYSFIDIYGEKRVVYRSSKGGFTEHIVVFEDENSIPALDMRARSSESEKDISNRVFVFTSNNDHYL